MQYTELQVTSNFSFLRGASHLQELMEQAVAFGYDAIAITDRNTVAGMVRAHVAAKEKGIRLIPGVHLVLLDGPDLLAYPTDMAAWSQLTNLLTTGNLRAEKGDCHLYKADVFQWSKGVLYIVLPPDKLDDEFTFDPSFENHLQEYRAALGNALYIAATRRYLGDDSKQLYCIAELSDRYRIPMVATNDVYYHNAVRRQMQDVLTCIREKCTIYTAGYKLHPNAERHLKPEKEMLRLFLHYPDAIANTQKIANACHFSLDSLMYEYPEEIISEGRTPMEELTYLTWKGAGDRYPTGIPEKIANNIRQELAFIERKRYASFFLTVYDAVRFARSQDILCQGRGSAANSTVCFCLGVTSVDPTQFDLLFERFVSDDRNEPPDIDVDFEHERREEVMQYMFNKYGRDRAAIVATVTELHAKGALRDVAKAMGLSVDMIERLSGSVWDYTEEWFDEEKIKQQGLDPMDKHLRKTLALTGQYVGFPRQLGQHTGGYVITRGKLCDLVPILNARMEDRTCIEWDKDDIDALGWIKVDLLALGMLTCIRKCFQLAKTHYDKDYTLANIPQDDPKVYDMICAADTIGVFQIESRAQQSMLPRLKPRTFYDIVIEVAIVRPGPIVGDMVHPYLRRRNGQEPVEYPSPELKAILGRTLGVPLFQEQAMKIAITAAGFTGGEADALRRSMATFKAQGMVSKFHDKLINGMRSNGYTEEYAAKVFKQLEGFGSYGFPESHAASFALLVWVSSWLKCHYPDVFACGLLNSQPMGFYQPAQIVRDAKRHGVTVRPVDINHSEWDNTLEEKAGDYCALRLGFRQVKSLREEDMRVLLAARATSFTHINQLRDAGVPESALQLLAGADAFRSIGQDRRQALWEVSTTDKPQALFEGQASPDANAESGIALPVMQPSQHVIQDYATTSLSLKAHPVSFAREKLQQLQIRTCKELEQINDGERVRVAGLVLVKQRPGTAKGVCFMTLEDETGEANIVVFGSLFDLYRKEIMQSQLIMIEGRLQKESNVIHVITEVCYDFSKLLRRLALPKGNDTKTTESKQEKLFPDSRNFR